MPVPIGGGGFVPMAVFSTSQSGLAYARTDVGGAFRWDFNNNIWIPLNLDLGLADAQHLGVLSLALDPNDPSAVFLAAGQYTQSWAINAILLSTSDQGATWTRTNLPFKLGGNEDGRNAGERLQVDPNFGTNLFLGTNNDGLWQSNDRGQTWHTVPSLAPRSITFILFDAASSPPGLPTSTVYVGVNDPGSPTFYYNPAQGGSWVSVPGAPIGLIALRCQIASDGLVYITFSNALGPENVTFGEVWRYDPAAQSWTNITPEQGNFGYCGLAVDPNDPAIVMVGTLDRYAAGEEIYRSVDRGNNWVKIQTNTPHGAGDSPWVTPNDVNWISSIAIDPFDSTHAMFSSGFGVWSSNNVDASDFGGLPFWNFTDKGLEETVIFNLIAPPSGAPLLSAIGDLDGFAHTTITASPPAGNFSPHYATNTDIAFAQNNPNFVVRVYDMGFDGVPTTHGSYSNDNGSTWTAFPTAPPAGTGGVIAVSADGAHLVWATTQGNVFNGTSAGIFYSDDLGTTWNYCVAASPGANYAPVADGVNSSKFYFFDTNTGTVYRSTDGGKTFAPGASGLPTGSAGGFPSMKNLHAVPGLEGELWLPTPGGLYHSSDSAVTFTNVAATVQAAYLVSSGANFAGASYPVLYLWGIANGVQDIFISNDEGQTWFQYGDYTNYFGFINALVGDPNNYGGVFIGTGGDGIFKHRNIIRIYVPGLF
jgi:photosystem II stability/assembly factor-like uncharacterized protein